MTNDQVASGRTTVAEMADQLQHLSKDEAGSLAKLLETKWGVILEPWRGICLPHPAPPDYDQFKFDVVVTDIGSNRLSFIKEARSVMGLGVLEANALIKATPLTIMRGVKALQAATMKRRLEDTGASVDLKPV